MNARTTLVLGVIAIVLIGYLVISKQNQEEAAAEATVPPVPTTAPRIRIIPETESEVTPVRLEVNGTDEDGNLINRAFEVDDTGIWAQVVPTYTQLISGSIVAQVNGMLNISSRLVLQGDDNPLSAYGLDEPTYTIAIEAERDETTIRFVFLVGDEVVGGTGYYLQRAGDPRVYVVDLTAVQGATSLLTAIPVPPPIIPTSEITSTLSITGTSNISLTVPLTDTGNISDTATVTPTTSLSNTVPVTQ